MTQLERGKGGVTLFAGHIHACNTDVRLELWCRTRNKTEMGSRKSQNLIPFRTVAGPDPSRRNCAHQVHNLLHMYLLLIRLTQTMILLSESEMRRPLRTAAAAIVDDDDDDASILVLAGEAAHRRPFWGPREFYLYLPRLGRA